MTQNRIGLMVFILSFLLLGLNVRAADIPMLMNYQGSVTDAMGVPVNGDGFFKFAIVNEAGDTAYWANDGATMDGTEPTAAITIPVSDGRFSVKLGDTDLANMTALNPSVFDNTRIYLRVWFSIDELNFEKFATDMQVVSTGFAFKAKSVGYDGLKNNANTYMAYKPNDTACTDKQILAWDVANSRWICDDINIAETDPTVDPSVKDGVSWSEVTGIPAGFADGTDDGIASESDPTVAASVKDGVSWSEVSAIPAGFADGTDDGITSESDPTVDPSVKDGVSWSEVSAIPAGFADGVDDGGLWTQSGSDIYYNTGNIGIGTTTPNGVAVGRSTVHIAGSVTPALVLEAIGTGGRRWEIWPAANDGGLIFRDDTAGAYRMKIDPNGNVGIGTTGPIYPLHMASGAHVTLGGVWTNSSSREYKNNIRNLTFEEAKAAIEELTPTRFYYNVDNEDEYLGFIAEDVPDLVATKDKKSLSPMDIVAVLTRVVQQQQSEIGELKGEIEELKALFNNR